MVRSVLYVAPRGGDPAAIVDFYRRRGILERAAEIDGFLGSELQVPAQGPGEVLVTALWRDAQAYERWVRSAARAETAAGLSELVEGELGVETRGALYEVVLAREAG